MGNNIQANGIAKIAGTFKTIAKTNETRKTRLAIIFGRYENNLSIKMLLLGDRPVNPSIQKVDLL